MSGRRRKVSDLTVNELRKELKKHNVTSSGKKKTLVD